MTAARVALWAYDYLLTFDQEVSHIWSRPITGTAILFILNRYVFLVFNVLNVLETVLPNAGDSLYVPSSPIVLKLITLAIGRCIWVGGADNVLAAVTSATSACVSLSVTQTRGLFTEHWILQVLLPCEYLQFTTTLGCHS